MPDCTSWDDLRPFGHELTFRKGKPTMLILIIIVLLVLGGGGGYYGRNRWGNGGGAGIGLGTILAVLLIAYLLGAFR
jgi:hypothetical protein